LQGRARERYGALDRLNTELNWYREQYNTLDALVEALRTADGWLVYRAGTLQDQLLELDARAAEDVFVVEKVKTVLVNRDEALQKAREDLVGARALAAEWEIEVAAVRAQIQQDRATLEGAHAWQSQAEEKDKEAEELRTSLADKAASLPRRKSSSGKNGSHASRRRPSCSRSRPPLSRPRLPSSASIWCGKRPRVGSSKSAPHLRGRRRPSSSGMKKSRDSTRS
jgi:chromosome segregation ATPase